MGEWDYEGEKLIAVYRDLDEANAIRAKANEIRAKRCDGLISLEEQMEAIAALGIDSCYDAFHVEERELL